MAIKQHTKAAEDGHIFITWIFALIILNDTFWWSLSEFRRFISGLLSHRIFVLIVCSYMRHAYGLGEHYNSVEVLKDPASVEDGWETAGPSGILPLCVMQSVFTLRAPKYKCIRRDKTLSPIED